MRLEPKREPGAQPGIKRTALRLFAERGVDGVTVREIALAAGQKNHAAIGYYFGSKEQLVRELILDGAVLIDQRRNAMLDEIEARGGPKRVREVVEALVYPSVARGPADDLDACYVNFIVMLGMTHRELFMDALENRWNSGYQRCLEHLRRLMPKMPAAAQNQRFIFMGAYLGSVLAMRARALNDTRRPHPTWSAPQTLQHLVTTITALLEAPLDAETRRAFESIGGRRATTRARLGPVG